MGDLIRFPGRPERGSLAVDLEMLPGKLLGVHLTEDAEVAVFVCHHGEPVGGLLSIEQAHELRAALTDMILSVGAACLGGGAA